MILIKLIKSYLCLYLCLCFYVWSSLFRNFRLIKISHISTYRIFSSLLSHLLIFNTFIFYNTVDTEIMVDHIANSKAEAKLPESFRNRFISWLDLIKYKAY